MVTSENTVIGKKVLRYGAVVSTNMLAKKMAQDKVEEGTVILGESQTVGRGRKNREWYSPPGGLWFSIILYPELDPKNSMLATMCASVAVVEGIKRVTDISADVKWPNDVLIDGKKVAGILTEIHAVPGELKYVVVGIGINVNNDIPTELRETAVSMKDEMCAEIHRDELLDEILESMDDKYALLKKGCWDDIRELWLASCNIMGGKVRVHEHDSTRSGLVKGIDDLGHLILDIDGETVTVASGDIELL